MLMNMLMRVCFYIVMSFFMFYLVKYYSVGVCDYKNKFFVEVGKGFFLKIFFKFLMFINVGIYFWEMWGLGVCVS